MCGNGGFVGFLFMIVYAVVLAYSIFLLKRLVEAVERISEKIK